MCSVPDFIDLPISIVLLHVQTILLLKWRDVEYRPTSIDPEQRKSQLKIKLNLWVRPSKTVSKCLVTIIKHSRSFFIEKNKLKIEHLMKERSCKYSNFTPTTRWQYWNNWHKLSICCKIQMTLMVTMSK